MLRLLRIFGLLVLAFTCVGPAIAESGETQDLPFTFTWTKGICRDCKIAKSLSKVDFAGPDEAWGIGYLPPGETGLGDYSILHSRDGGRTWSEMPSSIQHDSPASISFVSQHDGWILMCGDYSCAEQRLIETRDGGIHWHRLHLPQDWALDGVRYFGNGVGYVVGTDIDTKIDFLFGTTNHGKDWSKFSLPKGFSMESSTFSIENLIFSDMHHGVAAGCLDRKSTIIQTADGGLNWTATPLHPLDEKPSPNDYCSFSIDNVSFLDAQNGWLLVTKREFALGDTKAITEVQETTDGGVTWASVFQATFDADETGFGEVQFLSRKLGLLMGFESSENSDNPAKNILHYTNDGGNTWQRTELPRAIGGCRPSAGSLICASGFDLVRVSQTAP